MSGSPYVKTLLAADIGGTHSRFAIFTLDASAPAPLQTLTLVRSVRFATTSANSTAALMRLLAEAPGSDGGFFTPASSAPVYPDAAVFAIPGPTAVADVSLPPLPDEECYCPNIAWPLQLAPVIEALHDAPVRFINDFVANGFACALLPAVTEPVEILPGESLPHFPRAVVGGGSGLGHCLILPGEKPIVLGAEAGHVVFPFTGEEEDIARHFRETLGTQRPDGDDVVTGGGLATLCAYYTGTRPEPYEAPAIAAKHPAVLGMMARFYGRAVCHYTVNTLALGGVYITGGLAANVPGLLEHPEFAAELRDRSPMKRILAHLPVWHVRNQDAGLWGAAACASMVL
ncbi:MAG: Glucokinase [Desulfovibrio sp.]